MRSFIMIICLLFVMLVAWSIKRGWLSNKFAAVWGSVSVSCLGVMLLSIWMEQS
ncbi:hypothetical protein [Paenibacillus nasutitermitis]|uniref:Uncharacterized protein n=1 Tax=Paenibacillus nasutitermitis TaxID=1652958 RepID=A0A916YXC5_9BACL|nr:hypothetical protein [Paenibacillus nasutitermitis]GGD65783.1 hypothetical protein GCM10010911_24440 [Paenibacillus nasutitermitis]